MQIEHGIPQHSNKVQIGLVRTPIQLASFYKLWLVYIGCKQQQQQQQQQQNPILSMCISNLLLVRI